MEILQTKKQRLADQWPNKLEVLEVLNKREALTSDENLTKEYHRLNSGSVGEQTVLDYIEAFGENH